MALDAFSHLKYRFLSSPALYPYLEEATLSADDRAGIHLLAACIKDNAPLGAVSSFAIRGELPSVDLLLSPSMKCLRTDPRRHAGQSLLIDNSMDLLKSNFMRLSRAVMGTNVFLHRDYPDIPSVARDVMFYDGVKEARLTPDEKVRKKAIEEIYALDQFVNVKVRAMRSDLAKADSFKGSYFFLDDEEKIVLASVFEDKWKASHRELIKADANSKRIAEVVNGIGQCAADQVQSFYSAESQAPGLILGVANNVPYVRAVAIAINVGVASNMLYDVYEQSSELQKYFEEYPSSREQIAEACNQGASLAMNVYFSSHILSGSAKEVSNDFSWQYKLSLADEYGSLVNGVKPAEPKQVAPEGLKPDFGSAQPVTVERSQGGALVEQAATAKGRASLPKDAAVLFPRDSPSKTEKPVSVAAREKVKAAAVEHKVDLSAPIVAEEKSLIQDKRDKLAKLEKEKPGSAEHLAAKTELASEIRKAIGRIREVTCDCDVVELVSLNGLLREIEFPTKPGTLSIDPVAVRDLQEFEKKAKEAGLEVRFDTGPNNRKMESLSNLLLYLSKGIQKDSDFQLLRDMIHPDIVAGGGTHAQARLKEMRVKAYKVLRDKVPESMRPLLRDGLRAMDSSADFAKLRDGFKEFRKKQIADKADWDEVFALKVMGVLDPELPKALGDFGSDRSAFVLANISPEGYRKMAEKRLEKLDSKSDEYAAVKEKIDGETEAVADGSMAAFALSQVIGLHDVAPGDPVLDPTGFDVGFKKYSSHDAETQSVLIQLNEQLPAVLKSARDAFKGEPVGVVPQLLGKGAERSAFLISAGKQNGKDIPAVLKFGKELDGSNSEFADLRVFQKIFEDAGSDPSKWLQRKGFEGADPVWLSSLKPVTSKIFAEYSSKEGGVSARVQKLARGEDPLKLVSTADSAVLSKMMKRRGEFDALFSLLGSKFDKDGNIESNVGVADGDFRNSRFDMNGDGSFETFDLAASQLRVRPPEENLIFDMLKNDFDLGERQSPQLVREYLDVVRETYIKALGAEKGKAQFERILRKAFGKLKEFQKLDEISPGVFLGLGFDAYSGGKDSYPGRPQHIWTSATGDLALARSFANHFRNPLDKNVRALPKFYERSENYLRDYAREKNILLEEKTTPGGDNGGDGQLPFDQKILEFPESNAYLLSDGGKVLGGVFSSYPAEMGRFLNKFDKLSTTSEFADAAAVKDRVLKKTFELLSKQHADDIKFYVSHGADHGVRVAELSYKLAESFSPIRDSIIDKYDLKSLETAGHAGRAKEAADALIMYLGLLHDVGYSELAKYQKDNNVALDKFTHSEVGARMVDAIFKQESSLFDSLPASKRDLLKNDFIEAVAKHNHDSPDHDENHGGKHAEVHVAHDSEYLHAGETLMRGFIPADVFEKPFLFTIRIADNLEFQHDRLSGFQRQESFMQGLQDLRTDRRILELTGKKGKTADEKRQLTQLVQEKVLANEQKYRGTMNDAEWNAAKDALLHSDAESFLHFYSNWAVENVEFQDQGGQLIMFVKFKSSNIQALSGDYLYQVTRMATAVASCSSHGKVATNFMLVDANFGDIRNGNQLLDLMHLPRGGDVHVRLPVSEFSPVTSSNKPLTDELVRISDNNPATDPDFEYQVDSGTTCAHGCS
ncbi:hypothetical protein HY994_02270 [Candidatus Micrarchaeota archaeon]|nr:hypothetical protein [Candidatus Micrarchaeota archaeon]